MKKSFLTLILILGLTACGETSNVVTAKEEGEYIETNHYNVLNNMIDSNSPKSNCFSFKNDDLSYSFNSIKIYRRGAVSPIFIEPRIVSIGERRERIGSLEKINGSENPEGSYHLVYSKETAKTLGVDIKTVEVSAYFPPESSELNIAEFELKDGSPASRPLRFLSYRKTDLSELSRLNSLLDRHCR